MSTEFHEDFQDRASLVKRVGSRLYRQQIALVLGSGLSANLKLPTWPKLIDSMFILSGKTAPATLVNLDKKAEYLFRDVCKKDNVKFNALVRKALYPSKAKLSPRDLEGCRLLFAITTLVSPSLRGSVSEVITFNFDDVLEMHLRNCGLLVKSIHAEYHMRDRADLSVYHVHGLLPFSNSIAESESIVLRRDDFLDILTTNSLHRAHVFGIMRRSFVLFVGVSGDDDNLASLARQMKSHHGITGAYWGLAFVRGSKEKAEMWRDWGVFPVMTRKHSDAEDLILDIVKSAAVLATERLSENR